MNVQKWLDHDFERMFGVPRDRGLKPLVETAQTGSMRSTKAPVPERKSPNA